MPVTNSDGQSHQLPSNIVAQEFGEVNVKRTKDALEVNFTILMEPQGVEAEGWQTGVALDASASMKSLYGRGIQGRLSTEMMKEYEKKGWVTTSITDGRKVTALKKEATNDAFAKKLLNATPNVVEPLAREFISYLAGNLDADGGTTVIYWACGSAGDKSEVIGDFTEDQCRSLKITGPETSYGSKTILSPPVKYFAERFKDAKRGMYIFITDGKIDDLEEVKRLTTQYAQEIQAGKRNFLKCVLIGVGNEIDEGQMEELDDLDTGTDVDIWDHKIAKEMRSIIEIFAELAEENHIIAPTGSLLSDKGQVIKKFADGVPAKIAVSLPADSKWFELEVAGSKIRQVLE